MLLDVQLFGLLKHLLEGKFFGDGFLERGAEGEAFVATPNEECEGVGDFSFILWRDEQAGFLMLNNFGNTADV